MSKPKLKLCPFCGRSFFEDGPINIIEHKKLCPLYKDPNQTIWKDDRGRLSIAAWNRRAKEKK
jgi:hypothetical protein